MMYSNVGALDGIDFASPEVLDFEGYAEEPAPFVRDLEHIKIWRGLGEHGSGYERVHG
jgi:hypothetical protein